MQKQLNKIHLVSLLQTVLYKPKSLLLILLLMLVSSINVWANPGKGAKDMEHSGSLLSTVTTDPSSLFFTAIQGQPSDAKQVKIVINGVSSTAQTTITAPNFYEIISSTGVPVKTLIVTGNVVVTLFIRFSFSLDPGNFDGQLTISGAGINTTTVSLSTFNSPNPSFSLSALNFSALDDNQPSLPIELTMTVSVVSAGAKTIITAPDFYQLLTTPTGIPGKTLVVTGPGTFKFFVRFSGSFNTGTFTGEITASGNEIFFQSVPLKTIVTTTPTPSANPASLSGFTAVQGGGASVAQTFDLSVKGLPFTGNPFVTVTAPAGYSVALSANASFVNAFVVFAKNGVISAKVFARLNNSNTVGPVNGNISITGSQVNPITVPVTGTITAKPLPTITIDKTSLTGFTTTINKASVAQSYNLKATNLDAGVTATVKAPAGYEVSLTNVTNSVFSSQLTVNQSAGTINTNLFVRLKSQSAAGTITGTVQNLVAGLSKDVSVSGTVVLPPSLSVNPTSITGFLTVQNQASASKTYTVTAANLAAGVSATVTAPVNYELRLQGSGSFASTLTLTQNSIGSINRVVEVRLKATATTGTITGAIQNTVAGLVKTIGVTGSVAAPTLSTSTTSITFTAVKNQASAPKSYKVIAANLASGITATVTASSSYEISKDSNGVFTSSLTLPLNVTNGINANVFVRLKATTTTGTITGSIQNVVAGLTKVVSLSTAVAAPTLSVNPISLTGFVTTTNQPSPTKSYNLVAANLANGVNATATAPAGYEISVQGTTSFSGSLTLTQTTTGVINRIILVRLKAQSASGSITGNIANSVAGLSKTIAVSGSITTSLSATSETSTSLEKFRESSSAENELLVTTFPNPVTDQLTVEFLAVGNGPVQIRLLDLQGKVLLTQEMAHAKEMRQIKLSLARQGSGLYFLEVISGTKHKTVRIIKQ